jgi:hypothetical protein
MAAAQGVEPAVGMRLMVQMSDGVMSASGMPPLLRACSERMCVCEQDAPKSSRRGEPMAGRWSFTCTFSSVRGCSGASCVCSRRAGR